jgi:hypothetical protein
MFSSLRRIVTTVVAWREQRMRANYLRHTDTSSRLSEAGRADTTLPNLGRVPRNMFMDRSTYLQS